MGLFNVMYKDCGIQGATSAVLNVNDTMKQVYHNKQKYHIVKQRIVAQNKV